MLLEPVDWWMDGGVTSSSQREIFGCVSHVWWGSTRMVGKQQGGQREAQREWPPFVKLHCKTW